MDSNELKRRTKRFALDVLNFSDQISRSPRNDVIQRQLIRSATSVAANYRAACRARSRADFINKLGIVEEESDETLFWLEVLDESEICQKASLVPLEDEAKQILAIMTSSRKTAKQNNRRSLSR